MNTTSAFSRITVIIPSLDPDTRLAQTVSALQAVGFSDILLVDDGSSPEHTPFFPTGEGITRLVHPVNRGKGAAIKTALAYVRTHRPHSSGVVTCDGDGQHLAKDAKCVCEKMLENGAFVLGVRDFSLPQVPTKSRVGNRASAAVVKLLCGLSISDTQTGLRAFPPSLYAPMEEVRGDRFEYETNVLLELKNMHATCAEVTIDTVYQDENRGSHFRPFADSMRIASILFKYAGSSLASFVVDALCFSLFNSLLLCGVVGSTVLARIVSSIVNFTLNRRVVFHSHASPLRALAKYYALAVPVMLISAFGVRGLALLLGLPSSSLWTTLVKLIVDCILFFVNFRLQKYWIFSDHSSQRPQ